MLNPEYWTFIMLGVLGLNKALSSILAGIGVIGLAFGLHFRI
jgi:small conductance mechanosensitive channel